MKRLLCDIYVAIYSAQRAHTLKAGWPEEEFRSRRLCHFFLCMLETAATNATVHRHNTERTVRMYSKNSSSY